MAQLGSTKTVYIDLDLAEARKRIKKVMSEAQEANRALARLEERLGAFSAQLDKYGIRLEVEQ